MHVFMHVQCIQAIRICLPTAKDVSFLLMVNELSEFAHGELTNELDGLAGSITKYITG